MSRLSNEQVLSAAVTSMLALSKAAQQSDLEPALVHLVELRASQINGCAFCLSMHTEQLLKVGYPIDKLSVVPAWRDAPWFSDRERGAMEWAEAVTKLENQRVPDDVYERVSAVFSEQEMADLTLATIAINGWNRINVPFEREPNHFELPVAEGIAAD